MKTNVPLTEEDHAREGKEHRERTLRNRKYLREIADLMEAGSPLNSMQVKFAASALRHVADIMSLERPRPAGRPAKLPDDARLWYADLIVHQGMSETAALNFIADKYQVTLEAAKRKMGKIGTKNERLIAAEETREAFLMVGGKG